jgi:hypothetical protein
MTALSDEMRELDAEMQARMERIAELREALWAGPKAEVIMNYDVKMLPFNPYKKDYIPLRAMNMRTGEEEVYQIDAVRIGTVGTPVILYGKYDVDQIWFSFVNAVLAEAPPTKQEREHRLEEKRREELRREEELAGWRYERETGRDQYRVKERAEEPIRIDREHRQMYHYDTRLSESQFVLPFREFQKVENLRHDNTRVWDRMDDAKRSRREEAENRLTIPITGLSQKDVVEWLLEHTFGRFHINDRSSELTMEKYHEWLHAKLRFQGVSE